MNDDIVVQQIGDVSQVFYHGKPLYSQYHPLRSALRCVPGASAHTLYIVPSPLLGYGLFDFIHQLPDTSHVIALELDEPLWALTQKYMHTWPASAITLLAPSQCQEVFLAQFLQNQPMGLWKNVQFFSVNNGYFLHQSHYDQLSKFVQHSVQVFWQNHATLVKNTDRWLKHLILQIPALSTSVPLQKLPHAPPIVIAGAGLSLSQVTPALQRHRQAYYLLAVDTALPYLAQMQLYPDAVLALESGYANSYDFLATRDQPIDIWMDMTSLPASRRWLSGKHAMVMTAFAQVSVLQRLQQASKLPVVPALGSVGLAAVALAQQLTDGTIYLAGLDFAFLLGQNHVKAAYSHQDMLLHWHRLYPNSVLLQQLKRPLYKTINRLQQPIWTDPVLMSYAKMLWQDNSGRLQVLHPSGLDTGLPVGDLSQLTQQVNPGAWYGPRSTPLPLLPFVMHEQQILQQFLQGHDEVWPLLDYVALDHAVLPTARQVRQDPVLLSRIQQVLGWWQQCEKELQSR